MAVVKIESYNGENSNEPIIAIPRSSSVRLNSTSELSRLDTNIMFATILDNGNKRQFERHINQSAGTIGGFVEKTAHADSSVYIDRWSTVEDMAIISGNAKIVCSRIHGAAEIEGSVQVYRSDIYGGAKVFCSHEIPGSSITVSHSSIYDEATIIGHALIDKSYIFGSVAIKGESLIKSSTVSGDGSYKDLNIRETLKSEKAPNYFEYMSKKRN